MECTCAYTKGKKNKKELEQIPRGDGTLGRRGKNRGGTSVGKGVLSFGWRVRGSAAAAPPPKEGEKRADQTRKPNWDRYCTLTTRFCILVGVTW